MAAGQHQHQIWSTLVDVSYVGGLSRHLPIGRNINPIPVSSRFDPKNFDPTQPGKPLPDNFLRPYQGYDAVNLPTSTGTPDYNSLQVAVSRRFTRGLQVGIAYIWSEALGQQVDPNFGAFSGVRSPRIIQFSLKLFF